MGGGGGVGGGEGGGGGGGRGGGGRGCRGRRGKGCYGEFIRHLFPFHTMDTFVFAPSVGLCLFAPLCTHVKHRRSEDVWFCSSVC